MQWRGPRPRTMITMGRKKSKRQNRTIRGRSNEHKAKEGACKAPSCRGGRHRKREWEEGEGDLQSSRKKAGIGRVNAADGDYHSKKQKKQREREKKRNNRKANVFFFFCHPCALLRPCFSEVRKRVCSD